MIAYPANFDTHTTASTYIRTATTSDAPAVLAFLCRLAQEETNNTRWRNGLIPTTIAETEAFIAEYSQAENSTILLALSANTVTGFIVCTGGDDAFTQHNVNISIAVDHNWRGQGIGSKLIRQMFAWAFTHPTIKRIELEVMDRNEGAAALYERLGFTYEGKKHNVYYLVDEGCLVDAIQMAYYIVA